MKNIYYQLIPLTVLIATHTMSYGFCVYNNTNGKDTTYWNNSNYPPNNYQGPTAMEVYGENSTHMKIDQSTYHCNLTKHRKANDSSNIRIYWIEDTYSSDKFICSTSVFNKGGYVVIIGNASDGFKCQTYRD